ncbi:hypothetical protein JB92DRAFT_2982209 [Gautieria morchelliformis]|nr:hypothetical protein JB92DRAFT_2982209 [Gautieria morchelliformis]
MASRAVGCTSAILRFPRRNPLSLLVLIIPVALLLYSTFDIHNPLRYARTPSLTAPPLRGSLSPSTTPSPNPSAEPLATNDTRILLVSGFYPSVHSKHSLRDYKQWLSLFLLRVTTDVYFFTPDDWESTVREIRGDLPIHINTTFSSSLDIPPLQQRREEYELMYMPDHEQYGHSPEERAVLASKPYFLKEGLSNARAETGTEYKYAFWVDAMTFRHKHAWQHWPAPERVDDVWTEGVKESGMKSKDLLFFPLEGMPDSSMSLWSEGMGPINNRFSEGSFFGGMPDAIAWWYDIYFAYHDHWLERGIFVGEDQPLINALFLLYPSRFIGVWLSDPSAPAATSLLAKSPSFSSYDVFHPPPKLQLETPLGQCFESWYYYVFFMGSEAERAAVADLWLGTWRWMWPWEWVTQVNVRKEPCRLTRVLTMEGALKRVFGEGWHSPKTSLTVGGHL